MKDQRDYSLAVRAFTYCAFFGGAILIGALLTGLLGIVSLGVALGVGYAGLLMVAVCVREIRRGNRLRSKEQQRGE
ncbi:MAG: hypothetical protein ACYDC5_07450 [Candidatus Dormibacteria bacterium]